MSAPCPVLHQRASRCRAAPSRGSRGRARAAVARRRVERARGRYDDATRRHVAALDVLRASGGGPAAVVAVLGDLVATLEARGDCAAAVPVLREAIDGMRRTISADRHRIPLAQRRLGTCLARAGRVAEAESLLVASRAVLAELLPPDDRRIRDVEARLAEVRRTRRQ